MARRHRGRGRGESATQRWKRCRDSVANLEALAIIMLADAEDDSEQFVALAVAQIAMEEARVSKLLKGGRYGCRGRYNQQKSHNFFELLLFSYSDRWFKAWMR